MRNLQIINKKLELTREEHETLKNYVAQYNGVLLLDFQVKRLIELGQNELKFITWLERGNFIMTPLSEIN